VPVSVTKKRHLSCSVLQIIKFDNFVSFPLVSYIASCEGTHGAVVPGRVSA
jgi:hypothetical protein